MSILSVLALGGKIVNVAKVGIPAVKNVIDAAKGSKSLPENQGAVAPDDAKKGNPVHAWGGWSIDLKSPLFLFPVVSLLFALISRIKKPRRKW